MDLSVECYSGRKANERPVRFRLGDQVYMVEEIVDQWHGPEAMYFKLRADDENTYILSHNEHTDHWGLQAFRKG
jgi:hypothetical protein